MSNFKGILVGIARACRLPLATAIVATTFIAQSASATTISYTGFSVLGDAITLHVSSNSPFYGSKTVSGIAGQITLTGINHTNATLLAYCLDVFDFLQHNGTYTVQGQLPTPLNSNLIGGLILEGNAFIAGGSQTIDGHSYSQRDISAATQVAIWSAEYGSHFSYSSIGTSNPNFDDLVSYLKGHAVAGVAYQTLNEGGNQTLGYVPVPGPILGGGLPGLILAASGFFGWLRRKRNPVALA